jgi:hypothetical protein
MPEKRPTVTIEDVVCIAETDKAILCGLEDGTEAWIPISHICEESDVHEKDDGGDLVITEYIAREKGLV